MEFDLWNEDYQLAQEWGVVIDIPVKTTGQFGDLKSISCQDGNNVSGMQQSPDMLPEYEEETLGSEGVEWMESGNVGSILETLGEDQPPMLLMLEQSMLDLNPGFSKEPGHANFMINHYEEKQPNTSVQDLSPAFSNAHTDFFVNQYEEQSDIVALSSPNSPSEEVIVTDSEFSPPLTPENEQHVLINNNDFDLDSITQSPFSEDFQDFGIKVEDLTFSELDLSSLVECTEGSIKPDINSLLTVESTISFSGPSPSEDVNGPSPSEDVNIIQSSPELFKVITSSTTSFHKQFSPYPETSMQTSKSPKSKPVKQSKRKAAKEIPEHIILQQLDKKGRKKLQNKNAAIRYRQKKKEEAESEKSEVNQLEDVNTELKSKVDDIQREIIYIKNLMGDILKAKGIVV